MNLSHSGTETPLRRVTIAADTDIVSRRHIGSSLSRGGCFSRWFRPFRGGRGGVGCWRRGSRQAGRDRVVLAGLAAVPAGVHPHPGSQLGRHIQHRLALRDQPLGQRPARPQASPDRPAALRPPAGERRQLRLTIQGGREPGRLDHRRGHRAQHRRGVAGLIRIYRDHHIAAQGTPPSHRGCRQARRALQLRAAQTSLEPQPHPVSRAGRGAVREPEHPPRRRQPIRERARPAQRPRIPDPQTPSHDLNKLPITGG
jgi:hypothetical protein